jgi:Leucine-rich repeat (LRR) protein
VLDLEDTSELEDHHLDKICQLRHLKYLSVRGCRDISCLPNSLGNLRHLQTLDVRGTLIRELPTTITNLQKLQHLRADWLSLRPQVLDTGLNRYDIFNLYRFWKVRPENAVLPKVIGELKALHTLGDVNVHPTFCRNGNATYATLKELGELSQLRKLIVSGIRNEINKELWSAIAGNNQLRSLSLSGHGLVNPLDGGLCEGLLPPSSLESLTMWGELVNATKWIHTLQNLSKLVLEFSRWKQDDAIQALGFLPNLAVLRLRSQAFTGFTLHYKSSSFPSLMVLELHGLDNLHSLLFEEDAMPKLELLHLGYCQHLGLYLYTGVALSGLPALKSLKEVRLSRFFKRRSSRSGVKEAVERQAAEHKNHVRVNIMD